MVSFLYDARWYDSYIMMFVSPDTLIPEPYNPLDWNRYLYVRANPVNATDPTGHARCSSRYPGAACENDNATPEDKYQPPIKKNSPKDTVVNDLSWLAFGADYSGLVLSDVEAAASDVFIGGFTAIGCGGGGVFGTVTIPAGCGAGALAGLGVDMWLSGVSPLGTVENGLGGLSLVATIASDGLAGNTKFDPIKGDISIGKDTIVSARNFLFGLVPESNLDAWISTSQVKYDTDRLQGIKPGGSYDLFENWKLNDTGLLGSGLQFYFYDWR